MKIMTRIYNLDDLMNFLSYMVLYAPHDFPEEDYLKSSEQMTLERAFQVLNDGVSILRSSFRDKDFCNAQNLLNESLEAYRAGDIVKGARLLQKLESVVSQR